MLDHNTKARYVTTSRETLREEAPEGQPVLFPDFLPLGRKLIFLAKRRPFPARKLFPWAKIFFPYPGDSFL